MDCRSFYLQIAGRITAEILSCQLRPGQQMQSIRWLSVQYRVNPHTVQRAQAAGGRQAGGGVPGGHGVARLYKD